MDTNTQPNLEEKLFRSKPKGNNLVIALLIIIIVILLGTLIYLLLYINKSIAPSKRINPVSSTNISGVNKTSNITKVLNSYAGWKTYTHSINGSSFKYPTSWSIKENTYNIPPLNPYTVNLTNNGNTISFSYHMQVASGYVLASLVQPITVSGKNYDLIYTNYPSVSTSNCPEIANVPTSYPSTPLPQSCKAKVQVVYLDNISEVKTINSNSFGSSLLIPLTNGYVGEVSLTLSTPINTSTVNTNQYIKVFKQFLSTVKFN